jgi:hypothetical protein
VIIEDPAEIDRRHEDEGQKRQQDGQFRDSGSPMPNSRAMARRVEHNHDPVLEAPSFYGGPIPVTRAKNLGTGSGGRVEGDVAEYVAGVGA